MTVTQMLIGQGINFEHNQRWQQILDRAKSENKYIFMDVFATWCEPCKMMNAETFPRKEMGDLMNDRFLSIKMQIDQTKEDDDFTKSSYADAKLIGQKYQITALPTLLFFSPSGKLIWKVVGYRNHVDFTNDITKVFKAEHYTTLLETYRTGKMNVTEMKDLAFLANELDDRATAVKIARDYMGHLATGDLYKKENLFFISNFLTDNQDPYFKIFKDEASKVNQIVNINDFSQRVIIGVIYTELAPYEKESDVDWVNLEKTTIKKYGPIGKDMLFNCKLRNYGNKKDWVNYGKTFKAYFDYALPNINFLIPISINNTSWKIVQHVADSDVLTTAIQVMKYKIDLFAEKNPQELDTYANLLYKVGRTTDAIEWEEKAVKLSNQDKELMETLDKMKLGKLSWPEGK